MSKVLRALGAVIDGSSLVAIQGNSAIANHHQVTAGSPADAVHAPADLSRGGLVAPTDIDIHDALIERDGDIVPISPIAQDVGDRRS